MTTETETTITEPNLASRDREETEIVETVELEAEPPAEMPDIEDVIATQDDPRSEIYSRFSKKRADEIDVQVTEDSEIPVDQEVSGDIIESDDDQTVTPPDTEEMVEIKILGETRTVPKAKVDALGGVENYQIRVAAQEQMERNAHERRALDQREQALIAREQQVAEQEAKVPAMDPTDGHESPDDLPASDGQTLEEMARQYQEAVYDDKAEAPQLLAQIVQTAVRTGQQLPQQIDEDALREKVAEDILSQQRQAKVVKASQALIAAHPELNSRNPEFDMRMFTAIDYETTVVEREHPDWEPEEVVQEAYDRIQKWKGVPKQPETMSDKQAAKRAMTRPRTGTQRYQQPPPPPRKTNSDYVAEQRKARGLDA